MSIFQKKELWIGIGIGVTAGVTTGYIAGKKRSDRKHRDEVRKARRKAYFEGVEDGKEQGITEAEEWISKYCVMPEPGDSEEDIMKKVAAKEKELFGDQTETKNQEEKKDEEKSEVVYKPEFEIDKVKVEKVDDKTISVDIPNDKDVVFMRVGDKAMFLGAAGKQIFYPIDLFIDKNGDILDTMHLRENIKNYEHDRTMLNFLWNQFGWGSYIPDLDDPVSVNQVISSAPEKEPKEEHDPMEVTEEDFRNWDLNIDEDSEPAEKTMERERYLDEVERYIAHPEEGPRIISREEFDDECYLDKLYFDYFDVDNKFIENTDMDNEVSAFDLFGVTNGNDLFEKKQLNDEDDDTDIVHVKNFKMNCVMEVTRIHRAYETIKDGSGYIIGGTGHDGGTEGL